MSISFKTTLSVSADKARRHLAAVLLLGLLLPGAGLQAGGQETTAPVRGPADIFADIGLAWQAADEQALANLVHPEGLRVHGGRNDARITHYSPSQAFYYFKNLFRTHPTVSFTFERHQQNAEAERTRAMTLWTYRTGNDPDVQEDRLVLVLSSVKGLWRLSEIQTISTQ